MVLCVLKIISPEILAWTEVPLVIVESSEATSLAQPETLEIAEEYE